MKLRRQWLADNPPFQLFLASLLLCGVAILEGCGAAEKEPQPQVAVQVAPAKRGPIEETVSAEAVVFSLQQAVITPKITSTIRKFYVQRGSRVKQGQLLAELENADLASAEQQSKGEFEQAEAGYATTTEASLPQQIQKAELDAAAAKHDVHFIWVRGHSGHPENERADALARARIAEAGRNGRIARP